MAIDLSAKNLLQQFAQSQQIEIERLLSQYGTSLAEMREMYPKLTGAIEASKLATTLPTQELFFTPTEAADMGLSLQENWMLKFTPKEGDYSISLITPEKWEITEAGTYISPEGAEYSQADLETLLSPPTGGLETTPQALAIEDLTEEGKALYGEYQTGGGELDVSGWLDLREKQQLETEQIFGQVFPEQDIGEVLGYLQTNPEGFLTDLREIGWTGETESLLKALYPEITQEQMYEVFGRLPEVEESGGKNVLDTLRLGVMNLWYELKQGFTSLIPQFVLSHLVEQPETIPWATKTTSPFKPWELMSDQELLAQYGTITEQGPELAGALATIKDLQTRYEKNQAEMRQWLIAHPELQTPKEWEGSIVEKIKEDPLLIVHDPWYIANVAAESAAFTAAFMGTSLVVGAATGNPFIGLAAGWVLTTPAMVTDLYEDLLASGATEDQALRLATPIGAVINSVEIMGDLPFLRAVSPVFARAFSRNVKRELVNLTWRQLAIKGLKTFTDIEIAETMEEVVQQAIQNATVATIDENRGMFEGIPEVTLRTLVAILPLAIIGGGTHTAHLYRFMNSSQMAQINETIEKLTQNGVPKEQAELVAIGQVLETPEGQEALSKAVDEVSALPEIQRQAQTALNQIQSTNPDLVVPAGGDMGLGVKDPSNIMGMPGEPDTLFQIPSNEEIKKGLMVPNWIRTALEKTAEMPGIGKIQKTILGWRSSLKIDSQVTEDIVGRIAVTYRAIEKMGQNAAKIETGTLKSIIGDSVRYFGFNEAGYSSKMAGRLLSGYESERTNAGTVEHVLTHPEMYDWTDMSRGLEYVARFNRINKAVSTLQQKEGVAPNVINEAWMHRVVTGRMVEGEVTEARGKPGRGGRAVGAKPSYMKPRTFETMAGGIQTGFMYAPNPEASIGTYIEETYKAVANKRVEEQLQEFGVTPSERLEERYPEAVERAERTQGDLADAAKLHSLVLRAKRGEILPGQTLRAIQRRFPELGGRLRALIGEKSSETQALRNTLKQMQSFIKSLKAETEEAIKAAKEVPEIPPDQKIRQAFEAMEYEDRLAFRNTMETQLQEIGQMTGEEAAEVEALGETLKTDPVATFTAQIGKLKRHLDYFLKQGEWPESFTLKEAAALMVKPVEQVQARTPEGRVPSAYVIDELAEHFNLTEGELIKQIEGLANTKQRFADLRVLVDVANQRTEGIKRMLNILAEVEGSPENVTPVEVTPVTPEVTEGSLYQADVEAKEAAPVGERVKQSYMTEEHLAKARARLATLRDGTITEEASGMRWRYEKATNSLIMVGDESVVVKADSTTGLNIIARSKNVETAIPKAEAGMPEAGLQVDMFGYTTPVQPKGKGKTTQISLDDYAKLVETYEEQGLSPPYTHIKPKIEGISELSGDTEAWQVSFSVPEAMTAAERKAAFDNLASEAKTLMEARKAPYWQARAERATKMEIVRQPGIGEGYIPMPFAGGRIFNQDFIDACNKFFGHESGSSVLKFTSDAASILRITKASLDFSAMMIQGLTSFGISHGMLLSSPRTGLKLMGGWYKALADSTRAFFTPGVFYGYMARNEDAALQRASFGGSSRAIDYFDVLRGKHGLAKIAAWTLERIPLSPFERAEMAFYSAGEIVRDEFWKALSPKALKQGKGFELARSLDLMTGLADAQAAGVPLTMRQLESSIMWFAPNYTRACLSVVADIFRGGYTGAFARQSLGGLMAAGVAYYVGIQLAMSLLSGKDDDEAWRDIAGGLGIQEDPITGEVTWRPTAQFMTIKVGNYNFGPGGFWYGLVRLFGNISACINEIGERERIDLVRILKGSDRIPINRDNPFIYWWYTRASPLVGTGLELINGKDFLGYPIETPAEYLRYILSRFEPIWMEQGLNWMVPGAVRDYEIPEGTAKAAVPAFEIFGWRTFPESSWVKFYDRVKEYTPQIPRDELDEKQIEAWEKGALGWGELTKKQKQDLLERYPELAELYEAAQGDSKLRQTGEWEAYTNRIDEERAIYYERIDEYTRRLQAGEIGTREYRELCSEAGQNYGAIMEAMERDPTYASIYEYFDEKEAEGSKYEFRWDLAYAEYNSQVRFADDPAMYLSNGDYNWDERDRRIDGFVEKWGAGLYHEILDYITAEREEKGLNSVWIRKSQDTERLGREYWELPYKPISQMTEDDYNEGNIPAKYYGLWKQYQMLSDAEKEGLLALYPELSKDWRAEYRKAHPEEDAMLALWGYGGKLQSMEAYNLLRQWGKELGISLEDMGLGLPSESLIDDYFAYNDLGVSGNSAEAKLWRLENPEFTNWAMENWGWEGTEDYKGMEYYQFQIKWRDAQTEYDAIEGDIAKQKYLQEHGDFWAARLTMRAEDLEFPEDLTPAYVEWYQSDFKDYEDDWWLMEHEEFYKVMLELGIWKEPRDFSKVPTREVFTLYQTYLGLPTGKPRYDFRAKHPELDDWLVLAKGYTSIGDRGNPGAEKTPWEELSEAEQFKELFD